MTEVDSLTGEERHEPNEKHYRVVVTQTYATEVMVEATSEEDAYWQAEEITGGNILRSQGADMCVATDDVPEYDAEETTCEDAGCGLESAEED
jgi:hypothetical protein